MGYYHQGQELEKAAAIDSARQPTMRENLVRQRENLLQQLEAVNAALDGLDANPGVESVLTLLQKAGRY